MPRRPQRPALRLHKATGQGRVILDGKHVYLGTYGSPECDAAYDEVVRKWRIAQSDPAAITVDVLVLRYLEHCDRYYRRRDRTPTGSAANIRDGLRPLVKLFGPRHVRTIRPQDMKAVVELMISQGLARKTINGRLSKIRSAFKWGVAEGLCPVEVGHGLTAVSGLKAGRTEARETEPVRPVPVAVVEATLPEMPKPVAGLVRFQLATGCRPSEACLVRACDIDMTGGVWLYHPHRHKTEHHGHDREIALGPKAKQVVREFLTIETTAYLFTPRLVRRDAGEHYTRQTYLNAVIRACERAFGMPERLRTIPRKGAKDISDSERRQRLAEVREWRAAHCWCPLQLRHTHATEVRKRFGLEAAQVALGHSRADVTQVYAERDLEKARKVAQAIG